VEERFPGSGLGRVCRELDRIAGQTQKRALGIDRPIVSLRIAVAGLIVLIFAGLSGTAVSLRTPKAPLEAFQFIQLFESGVNDVVLVGAGIFFLISLETRIKRRRALAALRELRSVAHLIDMHQLTKDPGWIIGGGTESGLLPSRRMTRFELSRYLDYCSEALALTGKIAALYIQKFDDDVALAGVNEVESLTTGLSRKIWQKLMILYMMGPEPDAAPEGAGAEVRPE
jgi:hypothetical protein